MYVLISFIAGVRPLKKHAQALTVPLIAQIHVRGCTDTGLCQKLKWKLKKLKINLNIIDQLITRFFALIWYLY